MVAIGEERRKEDHQVVEIVAGRGQEDQLVVVMGGEKRREDHQAVETGGEREQEHQEPCQSVAPVEER